MRVRVSVLLAFILACTQGCALFHGIRSESEQPAKGDRPPLKLHVEEDTGASSRRHIKLEIEALTDLPARKVKLEFLGIRQGVVTERGQKSLQELLGVDALAAGKKFETGYDFESDDLTDFQVSCTWQLEPPRQEVGTQPTESASVANVPTTQSPENDTAPELALENFHTDFLEAACEKAPCPGRFSVTASLVNHSKDEARGNRLGLGLYWVNDGSTPAFPAANAPLTENEEEIDLGTLQLAPGESKEIHLNVDRDIPQVPGGRFVPYLRILPQTEAGPSDSQ